LLVPNAALRFTPAAAPAAASASANGGLVAKLFPRPMRQGSRRPGAGAGTGAGTAGARRIWVLRDGQAVPVAVVAGASDGRMTEVSSEQLEPGMAVIVEQSSASAK
jgi:HlyD family secretion protein